MNLDRHVIEAAKRFRELSGEDIARAFSGGYGMDRQKAVMGDLVILYQTILMLGKQG